MKAAHKKFITCGSYRKLGTLPRIKCGKPIGHTSADPIHFNTATQAKWDKKGWVKFPNI